MNRDYTRTLAAGLAAAALAVGTFHASAWADETATGSTTITAQATDPCCTQLRFTAGRFDSFNVDPQFPDSAPAPSAGLTQWLTGVGAVGGPTNRPLAGFDDTRRNLYLAHTFVLPQWGCIRSATLRVRAGPFPGNAENDSVLLQFTDEKGQLVSGSPQAWAHFGSSAVNSPHVVGLRTVAWDRNKIQLTTKPIDLDKLSAPPWTVQPATSSMIQHLDSLRYLDVVIQDDTRVDTLALDVEFCQCPTTEPDPWNDPIHDD